MTAAAVEAEAKIESYLGTLNAIEELAQLGDRLEVVELAIEPILPMAVTNVLSEIREDLERIVTVLRSDDRPLAL